MDRVCTIVGILNITPDSFSDGGAFFDPQKALSQAQKLKADGADLIDVGAESTRPGAEEVPPEEEWGRLEPFFQAVEQGLDLGMDDFSLDSRNPFTAQKFLDIGGRILNDVSGFQNPEMRDLVFQYHPTIIINHFPGRTVDEVHEQNISSKKKVLDDLLSTAQTFLDAGLEVQKIILDPGIGFGKTMELNAQLVTFAQEVPGFQVMIGHSRKRFLGEGRFEAEVNRQMGQRAIDSGAAFLRVHEPGLYG